MKKLTLILIALTSISASSGERPLKFVKGDIVCTKLLNDCGVVLSQFKRIYTVKFDVDSTYRVSETKLEAPRELNMIISKYYC